MAYNFTTTLRAAWRQLVNCTFKTIKGIDFVIHRYVKGFAVTVTTCHTDCHITPLGI